MPKMTRKAGAKPATNRRRPAAATSPGGISSAAVEKATGKGWPHWIKVLDRFNVKKNGHAAAAEHLAGDLGVKPWWSQMIVVGYEQHRGLRVKHQTTSGYSVSASRVIAAPGAKVWKAFNDAKQLAAWLPDPAWTVRTATTGKSMRITWVDGATNVDVNFYDKTGKSGPKTQVAVQHNKLKNAAAGKKMKAYWGKAMDAVKAMLEA